MLKKVWDIYKIQFIVTLTLTVVIVSTKIIKTPTYISLAALGAFLGTFVLELDYFVYAYFLEPEKSFSITLRGFMQHKDLGGALNHMYFNKEEVKEKTLNSVLFQIALAGASIFVASSSTNLFLKSFVLSIFANSIYKMADYYFDNKSDQWFWALKKVPNENGILIYGVMMVLVLVYSLTLL
ncbi:hypothetical protein ACFLZK_02540 [Patescibacteria group bacterium]